MSYVSTGRPASKCHGALKSHFQIIQNLAQVTNYFIILIFHKIVILQSSPKKLYPCD